MHPLPPERFSGQKLSDLVAPLPCVGYQVLEWCRAKNGQGQPEAVFLRLLLGGELDGASVAMIIKSRAEMNLLIAMLERHRDGVWPRAAAGAGEGG